MKILTLALTLCVSITCSCVVAAPVKADVAQDVATMLEQVRNRVTIDDSAVRKAPRQEVLTALWNHINDPSPSVRIFTLGEALGIAKHTSDRQLQQEAVELTLTGVEQEPFPALVENITSSMLSLPRSAFSKKSKGVIERLVLRDNMRGDVLANVIRLAGVASVNSRKVWDKIRALAQLSEPFVQGNSPSNEAPYWALARVGDKKTIQFFVSFLDAVSNSADQGNAIYNLAYLRQPETVAALTRVLFSEVRTPGLEGREGLKWAEVVLTYLGETVEDFSAIAKDKNPALKEGERLEKARQLVRERGVANLRIKD